MSKNTNLSFLTDYITADITNGRIGINNASPSYAFDVTGVARVSTSTYLATASGNVGIGTTSPATKLSILSSTASSSTLDAIFNITNDVDSNFRIFITGSTASDKRTAIGSTTNTALAFITNNTERLRIINTGNILVNTSTNYALGNDNNKGIIINGINPYTPFISFRVSDVSKGVIYANINEMLIYAQANIPVIFGTNDTERMRILSTGQVLVGTSSLTSTGTFNSYSNNANPAGRFVGGAGLADGNIALMVDKYSGNTSTAQWFLGFTISNQATASGVITANGASQAAFGSWSDRRLKENIVDLPNQLSNILALRPVEFDYIKSEGGGHQVSFIAQEFEKIYPDAVGQRPDGMKTLTGWGKTEAILVKAIQELKVEIDTLKNK